jgi:hypothetical protein
MNVQIYFINNLYVRKMVKMSALNKNLSVSLKEAPSADHCMSQPAPPETGALT